MAITPFATVTATPVPASAPIRFITAASASAERRGSAPVDTALATALAASWKPLVKSKPVTSRTMRTSPSRSTGQDSFTAMVCTTSATCSNASAADSSWSMMSFSFITVSVSSSPLNRYDSSRR